MCVYDGDDIGNPAADDDLMINMMMIMMLMMIIIYQIDVHSDLNAFGCSVLREIDLRRSKSIR